MQGVHDTGEGLIVEVGGRSTESLDAFAELGGAYLAIIGGTAALETTWIEAIEDVDLDDLNPESIWKFRVRGFGPCSTPCGDFCAQAAPAPSATRMATTKRIDLMGPISPDPSRTCNRWQGIVWPVASPRAIPMAIE